nr:hypothetical protein [uncultured archaeon]
MDERAVAAASAAAVLVALGIGSVGAPVGYDRYAGSKTMPDDSLYGLERAGEAIQQKLIEAGVYGDEYGWCVSRARERAKELRAVPLRPKGAFRENLLEESERDMSKAMNSVDSPREAENLVYCLNKHIRVLKEVRELVPPEAENAINKAIEKSRKCLVAVHHHIKRRRRGWKKKIREVGENRLYHVPIQKPPGVPRKEWPPWRKGRKRGPRKPPENRIGVPPGPPGVY